MSLLAKSIYQNVWRFTQTLGEGLGFLTPMFCSWLYLSRKFPITERAQPKTTIYSMAKGDFPCCFHWRMKVGKLRLQIDWHCIHTLGPAEKMKNSSLSWSPLNPQWISPVSVLWINTKVSRKDLSASCSTYSLVYIVWFLWKIHLIVMQLKWS